MQKYLALKHHRKNFAQSSQAVKQSSQYFKLSLLSCSLLLSASAFADETQLDEINIGAVLDN